MDRSLEFAIRTQRELVPVLKGLLYEEVVICAMI